MIDFRLAAIVIGSLALIIIVVVLAVAWVASVAFSQKGRIGAPKAFGLLFARSDALRIVTVLAVIIAVVMLGVLDGLTDGAVAVLSGVAGYVLGGLARSTEQRSDGTLSDAGRSPSHNDET